MTLALWDSHTAVLAPLWLLFYGCGVLAAGTYAVQPVRLMGGCFVITGILALLAPQWANLWLVSAFGGLHLIFGGWIYYRHGG